MKRAEEVVLAGMKSAKTRGAWKSPFRVLVADDDRSITTLVSATFKTWRISCDSVHDGASAIKLAYRLHPDVLILDLGLPRLDGFGVLAALKHETGTRDIKVVVLTACDGAGEIVRGFRLGADDYIVKPFVPIDLAARVRALGSRRPMKTYGWGDRLLAGSAETK